MNTWEIDSITSVPKFLAAVAEHLSTAHTVSFEIQSACTEARMVYSKNHSRAKFRPLRDTISPRTELHYCTITPSLAEDLEQLLRHKAAKEVFWHIKGYSNEKLLFSIHDADHEDSAYLSGHIEGKIVREIASEIGREPTKLQTAYDWDENHLRKKGE